MTTNREQLRTLIVGMRKAYAHGENAMAFARSLLDDDLGSEGGNALSATLIAYDLQTGVYTQQARLDPKLLHNLCNQVSECIRIVSPEGGSILEVGVGEATTLAGVIQLLGEDIGSAYGFDISWSRDDEAVERLGSIVVEHRLLENSANQLNPSGVLILAKPNSTTKCSDNSNLWKCPLTGATLIPHDDIFYASEVGIAYPVFRGVPLLREEHAVVASKCK